jgi:DNA-binding MarR family transcriptional regulator
LIYLEDQGDAIHKKDGWHIRLISTRKPEKKKKPLKPWQKKVLKALIKKPWQSAAILAKKVGRSESFVEGQLRRLEKRKLVVVRYDEEEGTLYRAKIPGKKKGSYKRRKRPT